MTVHRVDPNARDIDGADLACWLLFFLESHGATITLRADRSVHVDLNTMAHMDAETAARWGPVIVNLLPEMREILLARVTS